VVVLEAASGLPLVVTQGHFSRWHSGQLDLASLALLRTVLEVISAALMGVEQKAVVEMV